MAASSSTPPAIPSTTTLRGVEGSVVYFLGKVKQAIEIREGRTGDADARFFTVGEMRGFMTGPLSDKFARLEQRIVDLEDIGGPTLAEIEADGVMVLRSPNARISIQAAGGLIIENDGTLVIDTGTTMATTGQGLIVGDVAGGTGWVMNNLGLGAFIGGNEVHTFALGSYSWQGLSLTAGDAVIGLYGSGQGAFWDQSAGAWYMRGTLDVVALTVGAGKSITVDTSGSYGQIYFTGVGSIFAAVSTGNLLVDPDGDNAQNLYLGTGSTSRFASIIQYGLTFQWYRSGTVAMQLDGSGLAVGGTAVSLDGHSHSYAPIDHSSTGTTYGVATSSNYGHVQCATGIAMRSDSSGPDGNWLPAAKNTHYLGSTSSWWIEMCAGTVKCNQLDFETATDWATPVLSDLFDDIALLRAVEPLTNPDGSLAINDKGEVLMNIETYPEHLVVRNDQGVVIGTNLKSRLGLLEGAIKQLADRIDELKAKI